MRILFVTIFIIGAFYNEKIIAIRGGTVVKIFPDSIANNVSSHPIGINLDFFMDGGRFPNAKHSTKDALKKMGVKYLRYPGGEKSDLYMFSLPPYDKSKPSLTRTAGLEDYPGVTKGRGFVFDPLDFDEFMDICKSNNAEPVLVVAADNYLRNAKKGEIVSSREQLIEHAVAWVKYANIKKKYGVKYWMIANESWNKNNVNSTADIYAKDVVDFSRAMKTLDPSILIVANGDKDKFLKTVIEKAGNDIDRLCGSNYGVYNFYRGYDTYRDTSQVLIWPALEAIEAINKYSSPEQLKKFRFIVAEFGSIDWAKNWNWTNDIGHAIVTFDMAGQLLLQPQVEFSCFWNTRWIENESRPGVDHDALDKDGNLNPTGVALSIWGNFLGKKMIKSTAEAPVISFASTNDKKIIVYLINKSEEEQEVRLDFNGRATSFTRAFEYFGKTSGDMNPLWQEKTRGDSHKYLLKGFSITVIESELYGEP